MKASTLFSRPRRSLAKGLQALSRFLYSRKAAPFMWPTNQQGTVQWMQGNFRNYVREGFELNPIIYSAIMYKVRSASQVRLRAYEGDPDNPTPLPVTHPLSRLLIRPNDSQSFSQMHGQLLAYLNLSGNAYLYLDRKGASGSLPAKMYTIRPDRMYLIPDNSNGIRGYLYRPEGKSIDDGIPLLPEDVIHLKFPHPMDPFEGLGYGLSPLAPMSKVADVDNQVTRFLKLLFDRGGLPIGILKYDIPLDEDEVGTIKQRWREIYGGVDNWTDVGVLDNGSSYEPMGQNLEDMGFNSIDDRNESRLLGPFGVPPILIGTRFGLERSTYSNYQEARRAFWEDTMKYELQLQLAEYEYYLSSDDGTFVDWDYAGVPALKADVTALVSAAHNLWQMGVPSNEAFRTVGLNVAPTPFGEVSFVPTSVVPAGQSQSQVDSQTDQVIDDVEDLDQVDAPDESPQEEMETRSLERRSLRRIDFSPERKLLAVKKADRIALDHEAEFRFAASEAFEDDRRAVLAIVKSAETKALERKASIDWSSTVPTIEEYFQSESPQSWEDRFVPLIEGVVQDTGELWSTSLGVAFDLQNTLAQAWFADYTLEFAQPISQTSSETLQEVLLQGQAEGWSIGQMQSHIDQVFDQWQAGGMTPEDFEWMTRRMPDHRTEMIARTETTRAMNAGSFNLYSDWGVTEKEWSATRDGRERQSHGNANGQVVKIDKPFEVGGFKMNYPGDASLGAPASEFVNCRCSVLPAGEMVDLPESRSGIPDVLSDGYIAPQPKLDGLTESEFQKLAFETFGRELTPDEVASLSGASRGETILISKKNGTLFVQLEKYGSPDIKSLERFIRPGPNGPVIRNEYFRLDSKAKNSGLGSEMFSNQVILARRYGVQTLETVAGGSGPLSVEGKSPMNGYYTWARLGYDTKLLPPLDSMVAEAADNDLIPEDLRSAENLSDIMRDPRGRQWWRDYGVTVNLDFDLADDSRSMEVWNAYTEERANRSKARR